MPEGDTVWLVARRLNQALAGRLLVASDFRVPALATVDLAGATVRDVTTYGKHLLLNVHLPGGQEHTLHSHLKMEGAWHLYPPAGSWRGGPGHDIRAVLRTAQAVAVGYRLAQLALLPTAEIREKYLAHLGPDILGPDFDQAAALANLNAQPERALAEALLDQRVVAGLGMNYVAEVCFVTGVHPLTPVGEVNSERTLNQAVRMLQSNRGRASRVTTGQTGRSRSSWVHGRRTCLRCGSRLSSCRVGTPPASRNIVWCPQCQRKSASTGIPPT